ncbi:unnamed protein product [Macrosiphum euphorbiae]|uniref:HAT C-terminal dimerisation domain-containing protein n=2 Tax=Macrosiphum euphorbiae TaxID=13131 RepID=A0AAV0WW37_9HEMI|nr:unnamed protein product [Macrosiphum euphorbiae]
MDYSDPDDPKDRCSTPKKKRAMRNELSKEECHREYRKKQFQQQWLSDEKYKLWLREVKSEPTKCKCIACNVEIMCGKSEIEKHANSIKHSTNVKSLRGSKSLLSSFTKSKENEILENNIKISEIKLAAFLAEHNVALHTIDHLTPLLKEIFHDSKICKGVNLHRTKVTSVIKNIIAPVEIYETVEIIKNNPFSVLVDESTDLTCQTFLCLLVRFVHPNSGMVHTKLLELVPVNAINCSAKSIYGHFKECLLKKNIPLNNIVGVACDGAAVMVGIHNYFMTCMVEDSPKVIKMQCFCHSSALVASKACLNLPRTVEQLIRSISSYVSGSAKRCAQLVEIQEFFDNQRKTILKLAETRWLALHQCVVRVLECWPSLIEYFRIALFEDKLKSAQTILDELLNPYTKCYFLFLKYALNYLNTFNALFQSREIMIHKLFDQSLNLMKIICQNFVKPSLLDNISCLNFHISNLLPVEEVFLGAECQSLLNLQPIDNINVFKEKCQKFYITVAEEIIKRLPISNNLFKEFKFLDPEIALDANNRAGFDNLPLLSEQFGNYFDKFELINEWRQLPSSLNNSQTIHLKNLGVVDNAQMWKEISVLKNFVNDSPKFPNICTLARLALTLPHSNAEAVRIFSIVNDVKTKKRNRIGNDTLNSISIIRSSFQDKNQTCMNFKVNKHHIALHNTHNLYL